MLQKPLGPRLGLTLSSKMITQLILSETTSRVEMIERSACSSDLSPTVGSAWTCRLIQSDHHSHTG